MPRSDQAAYSDLLKLEKDRVLLGSCAGVLAWDERTYLPRRGAELRGDQLALLARMHHDMLTSPRLGELIEQLAGSSLGDDASVNIREVRRVRERAVKVPAKLVEALAHATTAGQQAWQDARARADFPAFRPFLDTIIKLKREEAAAVGYASVPYDALLDEYEPGATTADVTATFAALRKELVPLITAIQDSGRKAPHDILERSFPVDRQAIFCQEAAAAIGFDFNAGRLDVTTHPFCSGMGPGDVRLTTRYNERQFSEAFFGTLHEAGHGIYEQGLLAQHFGTPLGQACSLGIHESQSRTWENFVGRSRPFWDHWFPRARQTFHATLGDVSLDDFYFAINDVRPSFIRTEADEATYNLHIILRFELEQALASGDLTPADVPGAWNDAFVKSFGLQPANDAQGCLQDIHWSAGLLGYFPTYTLGNLCAAQFMEKARGDLPELDAQFRQGVYVPLKEWLNRQVHEQGQRWRAPELCQRVTGKPLSHDALLRHLRGKSGPLYGI